MEVVFISLEGTGAYLHKGDTVAVVRVHIGVNLEDKACKLLLIWLYEAGLRCCRAWGWSDTDKALQQFTHTEVIDCRAEEYRSQ